MRYYLLDDDPEAVDFYNPTPEVVAQNPKTGTMSNIDETSDQQAGLWLSVLRTALAMPGVRVDRRAYLTRELSKRVPANLVLQSLDFGPAKAGVSHDVIRSIASSAISQHRLGVTGVSVATGLPGGWWMAATIPTDLAQYFWHVSTIAQKLAYLHGWPELLHEGEDIDDETLMIFTIFVGAMYGTSLASKALEGLGKTVGKQVATRLPKVALTKFGFYKLAKEIAKWLGVKLTKEKFSRFLSKAVPIIGGAISGSITWVAFSKMSVRLQRHLEMLEPHTLTPTHTVNDSTLDK